jgi:hypothetical protein
MLTRQGGAAMAVATVGLILFAGWVLLKEYGCGFVQGHYFSPPVPARAIHLGVWGSELADARIRPAVATRPSSA